MKERDRDLAAKPLCRFLTGLLPTLWESTPASSPRRSDFERLGENPGGHRSASLVALVVLR